MEIWKDIEEYEGIYQVSNLGRVKSLIPYKGSNERIIYQQTNKRGYKVVCLHKDKVRKKKVVHRLVAKAFIPNPENKPEVDHINTIKHDNRVDNLRWVTTKENANNPLTRQHRIEMLKEKGFPIGFGCGYTYGMKGKKHSEETKEKIKLALTDKNGKRVYCITTGETFNSLSEAARRYNIGPEAICKCCRGKRKTAGKINGKKLEWEYI